MRARWAALAVPLALLGVACGSPTATPGGAAGPPASALPVPRTLGGLTVQPESAATERLLKTARVENTYARDGIVYGLRREGELMAVLELVHLTDDAHPEERDFRREIVGQIGGRVESPKNVGGVLVYRTAGNQQQIYVWFLGRYMGVLVLRDDKEVAGTIDATRLVAEAVRIRP